MDAMRVYILILCVYLNCYTGVNGWASFKHLSRKKREWLETIAVKQGLHIPSHVAEMQALSRVKRQTYSGCSGGGGGGSRAGGGGRVAVMETIVVTGRRIPEPFVPRTGFLPRSFPPRRGGGGGGGAPPPPPPPTKKPDPTPTPAPPPQEPPEDKEAGKMTYAQFLFQLEQLESQLPDIPPDQMAHKLRMLVSRYDKTVWRLMLNVNSPIPGVGRDIQGFGNDPKHQTAFNQLRQMMEHKISNGAELGVIKINGETVAFGHVITGATAGYDNQKVAGMNNLFATTISGDLGQSGLAHNKDSTSPVIGPAGKWKDGKYMLPSKGGMATHAEILGDIDGFNIGKRIMADKTKSLSQHFKEYYGGESTKRFEIFTGHTTKAELKSEVTKFANLYDHKEAGLLNTVLQSTNAELTIRRIKEINKISTNAVNSFCTKYSSELGNWCK